MYFKIDFKNILRPILLLLVTANSVIIPSEIQSETTKKKVLYLNSYHKGYLWSDQITEGIEKTLGQDKNIDLYIEYLDSKRNIDTYLDKSHLQYLSDKYNRYKFDVVITSDDNAFNFVKEYRKEFFTQTPVVFTGNNYFREEHLAGMINCTGVNEEADFHKNIELIKLLHPDTKKILIITDNTTTGKRVQEEVKQIQESMRNKLPKINLIYDVSEKELVDTLKSLKKSTVVLFSFFFTDKNGKFFEYDEGTELVAANCKVPLYGVWSFSLGYGIIGGWLTDGYYQGVEAANKTIKILSGIPAKEIPITYSTPTVLRIDYNIATKYQIDESLLPESVEFINRPLSLFEEYKELIVAIISVIVFLFLAVLGVSYGYIKSRKAEKVVRASKENLKITLNSIGEAVVSTDVAGRVVQMNPVAEFLTGWNLSDARGKELTEVFKIINPVTNLAIKNPVEKVLKEGKIIGLANHTKLISRNGNEYQIADTAAAIKNDAGRIEGVVLVFRNVTEEYRMKEALEESEKTFRSIIEALPLGLHIFQLSDYNELIFVGTNPTADKFFEFDGTKYFGKRIEEVLPEVKEAGLVGRLKESARSGESWFKEQNLRDKKGNIISYELFAFQMAPGRMAVLFNNITERKLMEEALKESEIRFRSLTEMLPEVVFETDDQLNVTYANQKAYELLNIINSEPIEGKNILQYLDTKDHERAKNNLQKRINGEIVGATSYYARRNDGSTFPILFNINPIHRNKEILGFRGIVLDMTTHKKNEAQIKRRLDFEELLFKCSYNLINSSEENLESVFNTVLKDIGEFSSADRSHIYLYSPENKSLKLTHEWFRAETEPQKESLREIPMEKVPKVYSVLNSKKELIIKDIHSLDDSWITEKNNFKDYDGKNIVAFPITAEGEFLGVLGMNQVREGFEWEFEYVQLLGTLSAVIGTVLFRLNQYKELKLSKEKAEYSDRLKTEFLAQVSHEIRTPVNSILSFAGLIKDLLADNTSEEIQESLLSMSSSGRRIIRTIDLLINMSQIQTGTYDLNPKALDICKDIIGKLYQEYKQLAKEKNLNLELNKLTENTNIFADEYTVTQIIHNILDNAIKYTEKGNIKLIVSRDDNNFFNVEISDTGIGIKQEYLPHIFKAFSQEEQGYTRRFDGNGLGLALVKNYCELNKIEIKVESEKGKGSSFRLIFNS